MKSGRVPGSPELCPVPAPVVPTVKTAARDAAACPSPEVSPGLPCLPPPDDHISPFPGFELSTLVNSLPLPGELDKGKAGALGDHPRPPPAVSRADHLDLGLGCRKMRPSLWSQAGEMLPARPSWAAPREHCVEEPVP